MRPRGARRLPARPWARRGERGGTLVFVPVMIVVVAVAGSALLELQQVGLQAHRIESDRRVEDLDAESAIAMALHGVRTRPDWGVVTAGGPCSELDHDLGAFRVGPDGEDREIRVECEPAATSGLPASGAPDVLPNAVFTVGGATGFGNEGHPVDPSGDDDALPFCHDWQAATSNPVCESGLYIGPREDQGTSIGGVLVGATGAAGDPPVVRSNSSVMIRPGGDRRLSVGGDVVARWECDPEGRIRAGYAATMSGWVLHETWDNAASLHCLSPSAGRGSEAPLTDYRRYPHRLAGWADDDDGDGRGDPSEVVIDTATLPNGSTPTCVPGVTKVAKFSPGYYADPAAINTVVQCSGIELVWFEPGTYYFDFPSAAVPWALPGPNVQIVGGTPNGWTYTTASAAQADKLMVPQATSATSNCCAALEYMFDIDSYSGYAVRNSGDGTATASVTFTGFETPVPSGATAFTEVTLDFAHAAPSRAIDYDTGYPRLVISSPGSGWGDCVVPLTRTAAVYTEDGTIAQPPITLTGGCPGTGWSNFVSSGGWTPARLNGLRVEYQMRRAPGQSAVGQVDGLRVRVDYTGRPAPSYPGGCDPTRAGVQFVLGGETRLAWNAASGDTTRWIELCGSRTATDKYGFAIYALPESHGRAGEANLVPPPSVVETRELAGTQYPAPGGVTASGTGVTWTQYGTPTDPDGAGPLPAAHGLQRVDGAGWRATWSGSRTATLRVRLPDLAAIEPSIANARIERVELRVHHREEGAAGLYSKVVARVYPQAGGSTWASDSPGVPAALRPAVSGAAGGVTWTFGRYDDPAGGPRPNPDWPVERVLGRGNHLNTPARLSGADLEVEFQSSTAAGDRLVEVDSIELRVEYRPARSLRPLRGCLTTRVADLSTVEAVGVDRDFTGSADAAYIAGNSIATGDHQACPLVVIENGPKLHVAGSIFAPTAALDMRGDDNDAPYALGGVVARHITIFRNTNARQHPAFGGGGEFQRLDREMTFRAYDAGGRLLATQHVVCDDTDRPCATARTTSYRRRDGAP